MPKYKTSVGKTVPVDTVNATVGSAAATAAQNCQFVW